MPHIIFVVPDSGWDFFLPLASQLEQRAGRSVWFDRDPSFGADDWQQSIQRAISTSEAIIVHMIGDAAENARWKQMTAWAVEHCQEQPEDEAPPLITVRWEPAALPPNLADSPVIDAVGYAWEDIITQLLAWLPASRPIGGSLFLPRWPRLPTFRGRQALLDALHTDLMGLHRGYGGPRAVCLCGPDGSGKTQTAVEYAHRYRFYYPGGIYWLNGRACWQDEIAFLAVETAIDASHSEVTTTARQLVVSFQRFLAQHGQEALLILDDVENPMDVFSREIASGLRVTDLRVPVLLTSSLDGEIKTPRLAVFTLDPLEPPEIQAVLAGARQEPVDQAGEAALYGVLDGQPLAASLLAAALRIGNQTTLKTLLAELSAIGTDTTPLDMVARLVIWHWEHLAEESARRLLALAAAYGDTEFLPAERLRLVMSADPDPGASDQVFDNSVRLLFDHGLLHPAGPDTLSLHRSVQEIILSHVDQWPGWLLDGAQRLTAAYRTPHVLDEQVRRRAFSALQTDMRETRLALTEARLSLSALDWLERLFDAPALPLRRWQPGDRSDSLILIQHLREQAHHQADPELGRACDEWLAAFAHLRTGTPWRFPVYSPLLRTLYGHHGPLLAVVALPDNRRVLASSDKPELCLWDVETDEVLRVLEGHTEPVYGLAVLPDGRHALTASDDNTLRLWDLKAGETRLSLHGHSGAVRGVAVLPGGQHVLSASWDGTLRLWNLLNGETEQVLSGHTSSVNAVAVLPDGRRALSASFDRTLRLWDLPTGRVARVFEGHQGLVLHVAIAGPEGQYALSASNDRTLRLWDIDAGTVQQVLEGHEGPVSQVVILPAGHLALSASADRTLRLWDLDSGVSRLALYGHQGPVYSTDILSDGRRAVSVSEDRTLRLWSLTSFASGRFSSRGHAWSIRCLIVLPGDQPRVLSASFDGTLRVWDLESGHPIRALPGHAEPILSLAVVPNSQWIVSALSDGALRVWNIWSGETAQILSGHTLGVLDVTALADGQRVLSASYDDTLRLWDLPSGSTLMVLQGHTEPVLRVRVLPDQQQALSASADHTLRLWNLDTSETLRVLEGHSGPVVDIALLAGGKQALSASEDATLCLWEVASGRALRQLRGHSSALRSVLVLPGERLALSAAHDHTLRLWDLHTGEMLSVLHMAAGPLCLALLDERHVIVGDDMGNIRVVDIVLP